MAARWREREATVAQSELPRGGHGGSVVINGDGTAVGGRGGRGGDLGCGQGGDGGGGVAEGTTGSLKAIGGDGGDAGRLGRPTLGAPSPLEQDEARDDFMDEIYLKRFVDEYGILLSGRGGDGGQAWVEHDGREYCLNVLLKLMRIWQNEAIDIIDDYGEATSQAWWNRVRACYPELAERAVQHMIQCEDNTDTAPPSPYPWAKPPTIIWGRPTT